jgi:hypothetical protein
MINYAPLCERHPFGPVGDGQVRQLNINDFFLLGKRIDALDLELRTQDPLPLSKFVWKMFAVRNHLETVLQEPCAMLQASQRAAKKLVSKITAIIPLDLDDVFALDMNSAYKPWQLSSVLDAARAFETILANDMPEMSTYAVSQIGILRTDDLLNGAHQQIAEPLLAILQTKAKADIIEAGKCLAFRLSTASAFHICRNRY